jgi:hypothetical protein
MSLVESIDHYRYPDEGELHQSKISKFLWFCAGADLQLLKHCPQSERIKEEGIGGVVLATGVLAFLSSSYAFYIVFRDPNISGMITSIMSIAFGFVWALIIFNLDRFIVSSTGHGDGTEKITWEEFTGAIPRLIMALIIGFTLSKPLEIRIMKSELEAIYHQKKEKYIEDSTPSEDARYDAEHKIAQDKFDTISADRVRFEKERQELQDKAVQERVDANKEASGKNGNGVSGTGPIYKARMANADNLEAQAQKKADDIKAWDEQHKNEVDKFNAELEGIDKKHEKKLDEITTNGEKLNGLVNQIKWAHEEFPIVSWALTLLLLSIEIAPILYKLMIRNGPYHYLSENQREIVAARYAVERKANTMSGNYGQQAEIEIFHQAEASLKSSIAHLNSEARLSSQALDQFENLISKDISNNPEKYVQLAPSKKV